MFLKCSKLWFVYLAFLVGCCFGQSYEDRRCRCICPSPAEIINNSLSTSRLIYTEIAPPSKCNCLGIILPRISDQIKGHENEFCPRCECKYETRNTTVIMVVVVMLLWSITLLTVYMGFLLCLDPLINKNKAKFYQENASDEARNLLITADSED